MNILRRNLSTTCIRPTSQTVAYDVTQLIQSAAYGIADVGGFWSKLPIKVEIKATKGVV